jgi:ketosteroid isomerase-like protein
MTPDEITALADRFFGAIQRGDVAEVTSCYAPDVTVWHNFDQRDQTRDENVAVLAWLVANVRNRCYEEVRRLVIDGGFVQQHVLRGTAPNGEPLEVPAMVRVYCDEGQVTRLEEYLDTAQVAVLRRARSG